MILGRPVASISVERTSSVSRSTKAICIFSLSLWFEPLLQIIQWMFKLLATRRYPHKVRRTLVLYGLTIPDEPSVARCRRRRWIKPPLYHWHTFNELSNSFRWPPAKKIFVSANTLGKHATSQHCNPNTRYIKRSKYE